MSVTKQATVTPASLKRYLIALPSSETESPSAQNLIQWIQTNNATLANTTILLTTPSISNQLAESEECSSLEVESLWDASQQPDSGPIMDLLVSSKIFSSPEEVLGVVYFSDLNSTDIHNTNLMRACSFKNIPLAFNPATATLCLNALTRTRLAILIFNPVAGQRPAQVDLNEIRSILQPSLALKVVYTERDRDVAEQAQEIVEWIQSKKTNDDDVSPMIIASGGDGTVSAIAGATANTGIEVGIVPRGTANAFSVALGIPTDVQGACRNILNGFTRKVDGATATLPTRLIESLTETQMEKKTISWINHAGLGFEAGLVHNTTRELKDAFGNFGYTIGAAQQLLSQRPFQCTFQVDNDPWTEKAIQSTNITIANVDAPSSIFAQGFGQVLPDDGLFEVTITVHENALDGLEGLVALAANTIVKDSVGSSKLLCLRCRKFQVSCSPAQKLLMDGEVLELDERPVIFECLPKGLNVIVPLPGVAGSAEDIVG